MSSFLRLPLGLACARLATAVAALRNRPPRCAWAPLASPGRSSFRYRRRRHSDAVSAAQAEHRACDACPPRRVGHAFLQTTYINVVYGLANLMRGQVTARITPKTWWANMEQGWVWDLDDFGVNQIGHPYQGSNYFTPGARMA